MAHWILPTIAIAGWAGEILFCLSLWASEASRFDRWPRTLTVACTIEAAVFSPLKVIFIFEHGQMVPRFSTLHLTELVTLGLVCVIGLPRAFGAYSSR